MSGIEILEKANWYVNASGWRVVTLGPNTIDGTAYAYFLPGTDYRMVSAYCKRLQAGEALSHE